jgi:hypothetical protein
MWLPSKGITRGSIVQTPGAKNPLSLRERVRLRGRSCDRNKVRAISPGSTFTERNDFSERTLKDGIKIHAKPVQKGLFIRGVSKISDYFGQQWIHAGAQRGVS